MLRRHLPELVILLLALVLRVPELNGSFWLDEAAQAIESSRPLNQQLDIYADFQPPLMHYIVHFATYFSKSEWWLRTVSALIPGLVTIWATMRLGAVLKHPRAGRVAGLLLATSSFHIFYSQELRQYSLPAMFAVLSWLSLLSWKKDRLLQNILTFAMLTLAGFYSSYLYPFLFLGQATYVLFTKKEQWQPFLTAALLAGFGFLPWVPHFLRQLQVGTMVRTQLPGWEAVVSFSQFKSLPLVIGKFLFGVVELSLEPTLILATSLVAVSALFLFFKTWQKRGEHRHLLPLVFWLLVPPIAAWIVSFWIPVIQPKRVLFLLPGLYLLVATVGWQALAHSGKLTRTWWQRLLGKKALQFWPHVASTVLLGTLFASNVASTLSYYTNPQYQRENWRELHASITSSFPRDETLLVFSFPEPFAPWIWYDKGAYDTLSTGQLYIGDVESLRTTLEPITQYQYVLVFDYLRTLTDPDDQLLKEVVAYGFVGTQVVDYPHIGFVRVYAQSPAVTAHSDTSPPERLEN